MRKLIKNEEVKQDKITLKFIMNKDMQTLQAQMSSGGKWLITKI